MPDRYEREIEELLRSLEKRMPGESRWARWQRALLSRIGSILRRVGAPGVSSPAEQMFLSGVLVAFVAYFLRPMFGTLAFLAAVFSLFLIVAAVAYSAFGGRHLRTERRWRGRIVELPTDPWWWRLRRWWRRLWS